MGVDLAGWIEVRTPGTLMWKGVEPVGGYIDVPSRMIDCLFGPYFGHGFPPIAPGRRVPTDASPEVRASMLSPEDEEGVNWITWAEIAAIDWDEPIVTGYGRSIRTRRGKLISAPPYDRYDRARFEEALDRLGGWPEDKDELEVDGAIYRRVRTPRNVVMTGDWQILFRKMEELAAEYGPDGVRLVVWLFA